MVLALSSALSASFATKYAAYCHSHADEDARARRLLPRRRCTIYQTPAPHVLTYQVRIMVAHDLTMGRQAHVAELVLTAHARVRAWSFKKLDARDQKSQLSTTPLRVSSGTCAMGTLPAPSDRYPHLL